MPQRRKFFTAGRGLLAAGVCALALAGVWHLRSRSRPSWNVILVTFDTTRADRFGVYGRPHPLTEAFDRFAEQGVVFDRAYAPVPLTLPSHASMLTGLYPPEHGLRVNGSGALGRSVPLLTSLLKQRGYETGAFVAAFVLNSKFGLNRGFDVYDDDLSDAEAHGEHSFDRRRPGEKVVDSALKWLGGRTTRPFFCWIHLYDAHAPYDARAEQFGDEFASQPYDAGIAVEVQQLARVLRFVDDRGIRDRTVIVVAGDHGEGLGEHGEEEHGSLLYNTTLRVPWAIRAPRDCRPGHHVAEAVSLVDLAPTLLDLLGMPAPKEMRGRSLRAAMKGERLPPRACYAETDAPFLDNRWCPMRAVITERWKYVHTTRGELFDLEQDPNETENRWETDVERRDALHATLEEMQRQFVPLSAGNVPLSENDRRILESLGYVAGKTDDSAQAMAAEALPDMKDMLPYHNKLQRVRELADAGRLDEALELARAVVSATTPRFPMAEVTLGDLLRRRGALDEAAAAYRAVLRTHPDCVKAHARLGDYYASQGRWPDAAEEYRAVIDLESEASQAHFDLARALSRMDQFDAAILEYQEAIRSDPGFAPAHFEAGLLLAKQRRFEESVSYFEQALKYDPRLTEAYLNLGSVLTQLKRVPEATARLQQAVDVDPESFEARVSLGALLTAENKHREALAQFQAARRLKPDDPSIQERISQLEAMLGRGEQPSENDRAGRR